MQYSECSKSFLHCLLPTAYCLLITACTPTTSSKNFTAKVVGISDGDTITVLHNGKSEKIRLVEIDCPELDQPFGDRAKQFASDLAFGKTVEVEVTGKDRYDRALAEVFLPDGKSLNRELVRAGFAWWYRRYSDDESLGRLEQDARDAKRGLWGDDTAVEPWEWRRGR